MNPLSNKQEDICTYCGLFGALLSATCLIQLFTIAKNHWLAFVLMGIYLFCIVAFILLGLLRPVAPICLIVSTVAVFFAELVVMLNGVFSLVDVLLLLYSGVVVTLLYMERIPKNLKAKAIADKEERMVWRNGN